MRRIASLLAALLSFLLVSTSASASVCDLSCSLGHLHDCQTATSGATGQTTNSMSDMAKMNMPNMDMGSMNIPSEQSGTTNLLRPSSKSPSCIQAPCGQTSAYTSVKADRVPASRVQPMVVGFAGPVSTLALSNRIRIGTSPPKLLADVRLITPLRV